MNWTNILSGLAQVAVPVFLLYAIKQGWLPSNFLTEIGTLGAAAGASVWSANTTTVTAPPQATNTQAKSG